MRRTRVTLTTLALALGLAGGPAGAAEELTPELRWRFRAQRHLERMGIRHVVATERTVAERDGRRAPEYRGRVTAPALAFLNGLSDMQGGMPEYRSAVYFVVREGGTVELRVDREDRIMDLTGERSAVKVYDGSRLPERVRVLE